MFPGECRDVAATPSSQEVPATPRRDRRVSGEAPSAPTATRASQQRLARLLLEATHGVALILCCKMNENDYFETERG